MAARPLFPSPALRESVARLSGANLLRACALRPQCVKLGRSRWRRRRCGGAPQVDARFGDEGGGVFRHNAVHGGIATQTEGGLLVPVLHHAEAFDLWQAAAEIARLADVARTGKATREELTGSTITITSLG